MKKPHLKPIVDLVSAAVCESPPSPWETVAIIRIAGPLAVGFVDHLELVLVVSSTGTGLVDCATGDLIARDRDDTSYCPATLNVQGLGPVSGTVVRVAGLHGGGLSQETTDGWRVERLTLEWPIESVLLFTPGSRIFNVLSGQAHEFTKIFEESGVIACGFSPSGSTLLLATADEITIYRRELVDNH